MDRFYKVSWLAILAAPILVSASAPSEVREGTILNVTGQGFSAQSAQGLTINASSSSFSKSGSAAVRENAQVLDSLRDELQSHKIRPQDISTSNFRFDRAKDPEHRGRPSEADRGFSVNQTLVIFVRNPEKAGHVLDALVAAGADDISLRNRGWEGDIDPKIQQEARKSAIQDAQSKARDYADALNMRIKRVVEVSDRGARATDRPAVQGIASPAVTGTHVDNGERAVVAFVSVQFELVPR